MSYVEDGPVEGAVGGIQAGEVRLAVPAAPEYLRVVRLTAAGLASRMGFTFDEVEDLRIAVDELCYPLVREPSLDRMVELRFTIAAEALAIEGETTRPGPAELADFEPNELSTQILAAVVDEHEITASHGHIRFRLSKRLVPGEPGL